MKNDNNHMDDLFDDGIARSLKALGIVFPRTVADFERIEKKIAAKQNIQPERLKDPYSFLGKRTFKGERSTTEQQDDYSQSLAQAAREGNTISNETKKKMAEDKLKANQKKNGQ